MRNFPIESSRMTMISTGQASPVPVWVENPDGSRRPDPNGRQDKNEAGAPLWRVEVIIPGDEGDDRDRTGIHEVTVACVDDPKVGTFGEPLTFDHLMFSPGYLKKSTGQLTPPRWTADAVSVTSAVRGRAVQATG